MTRRGHWWIKSTTRPSRRPKPQPPAPDRQDWWTPALLTEAEKQIIADAGQLWNKICAAIPDGATRDADLAELIAPIHLIQRYFMGQAAARTYPGSYRLLGSRLHRKER